VNKTTPKPAIFRVQTTIHLQLGNLRSEAIRIMHGKRAA
jgi:hypothetical protein